MKKGFKQRISVLLATAMIFTMNTPVLAGTAQMLSVDDVIITDETVDAQASYDEGVIVDESGSMEAVAEEAFNEADLIVTEDEYNEVDAQEAGTASDWDIRRVSDNSVASEADYSLDVSNNKITIKTNSANKAGLVISPVSATASSNLVVEADTVPVTVSVGNAYNGVAALNVAYSGSNVAKVGADTLVMLLGNTASYIAPGQDMATEGVYLFAREQKLQNADLTIERNEYLPLISVTGSGLGSPFEIAKIEGDGLFDIVDDPRGDFLYGSGSGKYVVAFNEGSAFTTMRTINFEELKIADPTSVSASEVTDESISGKVNNAIAGQAYEAFVIPDSEESNITGGPVDVAADGTFTISGLSENSTYRLYARQVSNNSATRYTIASDGVLYIPSVPVMCEAKTLKGEYELISALGSDLTLEGTGNNKTADMLKVVINNDALYTQSGNLILMKGGATVSGNVTWASDNSDVVAVSSTGAVTISAGAKDGDKAVITATDSNSKSAKVTVTVKSEGGTLSFNDVSGNQISSLEAVTEEETQFKVTFPAAMSSALTLSASAVDKAKIAKITAGTKDAASALFTVLAGSAKGDTSIKINAVYTASNGKNYTKELTLPVTVEDKPLEFSGVMTGKDNKKYITMSTAGAKVIAPFEATFASDNTKVATISANSGEITPVAAGKVKFTASGVSEDIIRESKDLYVLDSRATVTPEGKVSWGKEFTVKATFPEGYYDVTNIKLEASSNPAIDIKNTSYKDGVLTIRVLSKNSLSKDSIKNDADLIFTVTANGNISGETGIFSTATAKITISGSSSVDPDPNDVAAYNSYNIFYTDVEIPVEGLTAAVGDAPISGKAADFFVRGDGDVIKLKDKADAKKAANQKNSLIEITKDDKTFSYQLPVYYKEPKLKLTSAKGTVKAGAAEPTTLHTTVTMMNSSKVYEPLEVDIPAEVTFDKSGVTLTNGENDGDINIEANAKVSGKLVVKKANWAKGVKLSYKVTESKKDVLEGSVKTVYLNTNAEGAEAQVVTLTLNGGEDMEGVNAAYPNNWSKGGITIDGIKDDDLTLEDNTLSIHFTDDEARKAAKTGTYKVSFKSSDNVRFTLNVKVSTSPLDNAVGLKAKSKIDITGGTKMIVVPTIKSVQGPIMDVTFEAGKNDNDKFECTYDEASNQIIVNPADDTLAAGKYTVLFHINSAGAEFDVPLKNFKVEAKKPSVQIPEVKFRKADFGKKALAGAANISATSKVNGIIYSVEPVDVSFAKATATTSEDTVVGAGWYKDYKTNVYLQYDKESGKINIVAPEGSKKGTVKVEVKFKGQTKVVNANLKIQAK